MTFFVLLAGIVLGAWRVYLSTTSFWWTTLAAFAFMLVAFLLNGVVFLGPTRTGSQAFTLVVGFALAATATVAIFPVTQSGPTPQEAGPDARATTTRRTPPRATETAFTPSPPAAETLSTDDTFLLTVRAATSLTSLSDEKLLALGQAVCSDVDQGGTWYEVLADASKAGLDGSSAGGLIAAATNNLCPEYRGFGPED